MGSVESSIPALRHPTHHICDFYHHHFIKPEYITYVMDSLVSGLDTSEQTATKRPTGDTS